MLATVETVRAMDVHKISGFALIIVDTHEITPVALKNQSSIFATFINFFLKFHISFYDFFVHSNSWWKNPGDQKSLIQYTFFFAKQIVSLFTLPVFALIFPTIADTEYLGGIIAIVIIVMRPYPPSR